LEKYYFWKNIDNGRLYVMEERTIGRIDEQGRIYIYERIRKRANIKPGSLVEIIARPGEIIIRRASSVVKDSMGCFKIKKEFEDALEDIDYLIRKISAKRVLEELKHK